MSEFVINLLLSILFFILIPICHYWVFIKGPKDMEKEGDYNPRTSRNRNNSERLKRNRGH